MKLLRWGLLLAALLVVPFEAQAQARPPAQKTGPITVYGTGSTGDMSLMSVTPSAAAPDNSLAKTLYAPKFPGPVTAQGTGGYWPDRPGGANIQRMGDRLFIGPDATSWAGNIGQNGSSWPWTMGRSIFGYLPRNAQVTALSPFGQIGILSGAQTSDSAKLPGEPTSGCCGIPFASLLRNNNAAIPQDAWNYYATGVKEAGAGGVHNAEFDVLNATSTVVRIGPYKQDPGGITLGIALNAGGEGAPYNAGPVTGGLPPYPNVSASSAAMQIGGNGTTFDKGIVVKSASVSPTEDGSTVAVDMPTGYSLRWTYDGTDKTGAFITSFVSSPATQHGLVFSDNGLLLQNRDGSNLFAQFSATAGTVNRPLFQGGAAGNAVTFAAAGSDASIDIKLAPQGGGLVDLQSGVLIPVGPTPASSSTCRTGQLRTDGAYTYWCVSANHWKRQALADY